MNISVSDNKTSFDENGFVVVKNLFDSIVISEMSDEINRLINDVNNKNYLQEEPYNSQSIRKIKDLTSISPIFLKYAKSPQIIAIIEDLISSKIRLHGGIGWLKPKRIGCAMHPHQDAAYWNHIQPSKFIICWIAIDKSTEENGCLRYLKKSHKTGKISHQGERTLFLDINQLSFYEYEVVELNPGDAIFHDGYAVHWSSENRSEYNRRGVSFSYFSVSSQLVTDFFKENEFPFL